MSQLSPYKLVQTTSQEPPAISETSPIRGWMANDRPVFVIKAQPGQAIRQGSIRLNGTLTLWRLGGAETAVEVDPQDEVYLNPNAGINGFFKQITTNINGRPVENVIEFGRLVALRNEFSYYQADHACSVDAMNELMAFSNDDYSGGDDSKVFSGDRFNKTGNSAMPFSVDLDFCINRTNGNVSFAKTGDIELAIVLQATNQCGMLAKGNISGATYEYTLTNLELRYMTVPDVSPKAPLVMEIKNNPASPTVYASLTSNLLIAPVQPFHSVFCGLHQSNHTSTLALNYDYLASEAFPVELDYLEIKQNNGNPDTVQFPLRLQMVEILHNFLKAVNPEGEKHGASYSKLANVIKTGYGLGLNLGEQVPAGTAISFNMNFKSVLPNPFSTSWFSIGNIEL